MVEENMNKKRKISILLGSLGILRFLVLIGMCLYFWTQILGFELHKKWQIVKRVMILLVYLEHEKWLHKEDLRPSSPTVYPAIQKIIIKSFGL